MFKNLFLIFIGVVIVILILYYSSAPSVKLQNNCELYTGCKFTEEGLLISIIKYMNKEVKLRNMYIKSIKSNGLNIILYSNPDFTGEKKILTNNINIECLEPPMKSIIIQPI
jgi:hypothetical protein